MQGYIGSDDFWANAIFIEDDFWANAIFFEDDAMCKSESAFLNVKIICINQTCFDNFWPFPYLIFGKFP